MADKKKSPQTKREDTVIEDEHVKEAYEQAENDIEKDPDLNDEPSQEDDLDEGELARLEGED